MAAKYNEKERKAGKAFNEIWICKIEIIK
jgi:hypothetical protein